MGVDHGLFNVRNKYNSFKLVSGKRNIQITIKNCVIFKVININRNI